MLKAAIDAFWKANDNDGIQIRTRKSTKSQELQRAVLISWQV